jgi:hypothetical protein
MSKAQDENFLKRWSDLKTADRSDTINKDSNEIVEISKTAGEVNTSTEQEQSSAIPDDLPDIDTLDGDSDYTLFLRNDTPEHLKRLALKKLFNSNPIFAGLDGLNDYDEDYSMIGMVTEAVATRYKPGKGMFDPDQTEEVVNQSDSQIIDENSDEHDNEVSTSLEGSNDLEDNKLDDESEDEIGMLSTKKIEKVKS